MRFKGATVLTGLLAAALTFGAGPRTAAAEEVKFLMDWIFGGKHIAFFVARDKGYYKKNGLDVTLLQGRGSGMAATNVDTKQVDYSYGDFPTMLRAVSKGAKNVAIGAGIVYQGGGFMFLESSGIKTAKDFEGKRYGSTPTDFGNVLLPAMAAASGFDVKKVKIMIMKEAVRTPALFEGKIDFFSGARGSSLPRMAIIAKRQGKKLNFLYFKDLGIDTYGHMIQTHPDRINGNPDQIRKLLQASYEAWAWSIKNPKEAFEVFMQANREKDREISQAQVEEGLMDVQDPETKGKGLGYMKESLVKKSAEISNKYFNLKPPVDYKATYTNRFIGPTPGM
ncbi:MAG: ABC transporter substrate-binding protein [Candidatus Tectomicrobia bacterium]|nr:ABC transporter substrate-binding protein [Candidatus Tectomicrobia bacterium]